MAKRSEWTLIKFAFLCAPAALPMMVLYWSCIDSMFTILIYDLTTLQRLTITRCAVIAEKQFRFFSPWRPSCLRAHPDATRARQTLQITERSVPCVYSRAQMARTARAHSLGVHATFAGAKMPWQKVQMDLSPLFFLCTVASPVVGL